MPKHKAYTGNAPWTNGGLATIPNPPSSGTFPWSLYHPTEPWTACVDANGSGVGVYTPIATTFLAVKYGSGVTTNPFDISTMYVSPLGQYAFAEDTVFTYRFYLILGKLMSSPDPKLSIMISSHTPRLLTALAGICLALPLAAATAPTDLRVGEGFVTQIPSGLT